MFASAYVWAKIINYLEEKLSDTMVSAWFDDAEVVELNEDFLILYTPDEFRREIITRRCAEFVQDALHEIFHSDAKLKVFGPEEMESYKALGKRSNMDFNPQFTFDSFVVGSSNRFAYSAAIAVTNTPGQVYNPLFIYGPPGVGKTHLLYAIANGIRQNNPDTNVVYIKGDQFTTELIDAIKTGKNIEFRSKYREADLFLIDDVQFISGKEGTQEEFFHTFNTLYENHKQIVMTSDRKPGDMLTLEERLRTRFEWGLLADIQPPDYETRMAIIKTKANSLGIELSDEICNFIAVNVTNNVRQLEGTVKKIKAYHDLDGMPLVLTNISKVIGDMYKSGDGSTLPTPGLIIGQVCKFYSVDESVLRGTLKNKGTAEARQVAIYLIRKLTNLSTPDIGKELNKDHSTVLYSINKITDALNSGDENLKKHIQDITANINSCL